MAVDRISGPPMLRRMYTITVLRARRAAAGPGRIAEVVTATGLVRSTIAQMLEDPAADGWPSIYDPSPPVGKAGRRCG